MKKIYVFIIILLVSGTTVFAQEPDLSIYWEEYNRSNATISEMLGVLKAVRDENQTGIGSFYRDAIRVFVQRLPNYTSNQDRLAIEEISSLLFRGLSAEKQTDAALYVWQLVHYFDISHRPNDGILMYEAIVTLGQIDAKDFASYIAILLERYNERSAVDPIYKSITQVVVPGTINALETLGEPVGVRPIFFASIGWYDNDLKAIASKALVNLMNKLGDTIGEIIIGIINDLFNSPSVKNAAWQEFLQTTTVSDEVKAKVASVALEASYTFITSSRESLAILRIMRVTAIDKIREVGIADETEYAFLERTYREALEGADTDYETIILVIRTLTAVNTEESVNLLTEFLRGLHYRKRSGLWGSRERDLISIIISAISTTGTQARPTIQLLTVIQNSAIYTIAEQNWARNALATLARSNR